VRKIIDLNYQRAEKLLTDNMQILHNMAEALIKYETIDLGQIDDLMAGKKARPPANWEDDEPSQGGNAAVDTDSKAGPIGGPASMH